ncbi:MAG: DUF4293 domain-containing protein [Bacteroidetes bacterium]|nr:DUF4293 domain-containing protein [Bacteroidota bacterium]
MIQRIQTVYLLCASLISGVVVLFVNFGQSSDGSVLNFIDFFNNDSNLLLTTGLLFYLSSLLSFIAIFLYLKRTKQLLIGKINLALNLLIIFMLIYYLQSLSGEILISMKGIGVALPLFTSVLILLANKAIRKDENLVKSVDRLR